MSLKVKLLRSFEGRSARQRGTITGLGLKRINDVRVLQDTPAVMGMILKVQHLIAWEKVSEAAPKRKRVIPTAKKPAEANK